jgi:hypothetical protein
MSQFDLEEANRLRFMWKIIAVVFAVNFILAAYALFHVSEGEPGAGAELAVEIREREIFAEAAEQCTADYARLGEVTCVMARQGLCVCTWYKGEK